MRIAQTYILPIQLDPVFGALVVRPVLLHAQVLTDRYQITGYDRSYHGALIDSEILADVYLAMTGGQRDLGFDDSTSKDFQSKFENDSSDNLNLVKIKASEDDNNQHKNYLNSLEIDHGSN